MFDHYLAQVGARSEANRPIDVEPENLNGHYKTVQGSLTVDAAQNDVVGLFPVPLHATLSHEISRLAHTALAGATTFDVGFAARDDIEYAGDDDALAADLDVSAAGVKSLVAGLGADDLGKKVWELMGLTPEQARRAGGEVWVIGTFKGANPAAGSIGVEQAFTAK